MWPDPTLSHIVTISPAQGPQANTDYLLGAKGKVQTTFGAKFSSCYTGRKSLGQQQGTEKGAGGGWGGGGGLGVLHLNPPVGGVLDLEGQACVSTLHPPC